ncbi:MAG: cohesin domain-containing protein [Bacteroidota bacterium]
MKKFLVLLFIVMIGSTAYSQVQVSFPKGVKGATGDTVKIPINVSDLTGSDVEGYDFRMLFDPAVLQPLSGSAYDTVGTITSNKMVIVDNPDSAAFGIYRFAGSILAGDPLKGSGKLINIKFRILGDANSRSVLRFSYFRFNEGIPPAVITEGSFGRPFQPTLVSPANGDTVSSTAPTLIWNKAIGAETYHLQVSTSSSFTTSVFNDSTLIDTSIVVSGLTTSMTYYWRVNAKNTAGTSEYSTTRLFSTQLGAPPVPTLNSPADSAVDIPISTVLSWYPSTGADKYRLQVSTSSSFATTYVDDSSIAATQYSTSGLTNYTVYYWRVSAKNTKGWSAYSAARHFRTIPLPPETAPILISPADGALGVPVNPTLSWNAVPTASKYHLQVSTNSNFLVNYIDDTTITTTSRQITGLTHNQTYYWHVSTKNAAGESDFSTFRNFKTVLSAPTLLSPANGATAQPSPLTLQWIVEPLATSYRVQVSIDSGFTTTFVNDTTDTTSMIISNLDTSKIYYWHVCSKNGEGTSEYSSRWHFTTAATNAIERLDNAIPKDFGLSQNYPNPFNPTTNIEFRIAKQSYVTLEVFDILGHRIATLVNEVKSPGIYNVTMDGSTLASGMYFYTMKANNFTMTKKLVLMK